MISNYVAYVKRDVSERESEDHIAMKILAIKELHERYGTRLENITCTCEVGKGVIADVYVDSKGLAIECETLLGTSPAPLLKIFESVKKYNPKRLSKPVNEVWVIIRNWPAILHIGDLLWAENILRRELRELNVEVKFFIPDVHRRSLRALDDIIRGFNL